jgi:hypothetical protein
MHLPPAAEITAAAFLNCSCWSVRVGPRIAPVQRLRIQMSYLQKESSVEDLEQVLRPISPIATYSRLGMASN